MSPQCTVYWYTVIKCEFSLTSSYIYLHFKYLFIIRLCHFLSAYMFVCDCQFKEGERWKERKRTKRGSGSSRNQVRENNTLPCIGAEMIYFTIVPATDQGLKEPKSTCVCYCWGCRLIKNRPVIFSVYNIMCPLPVLYWYVWICD